MTGYVPLAPAYIYRATCSRVIDGDTFVALVDLGFDTSRTISVRLLGVNAPEHNRPGGPEATQYLDSLLQGNAPLLIQSYKDEQSFARWVCDVWTQGQNLAQMIISAGHGVTFDPRVDKWKR